MMLNFKPTGLLCTLLLSCLAGNILNTFSLICILLKHFLCVCHGHFWSHECRSDVSSSINLSTGTEVDQEGTLRGETAIAPILSLLVFSLVQGDSSGLPMFVFISTFLHFHPNLSISGLFPEAISV